MLTTARRTPESGTRSKLTPYQGAKRSWAEFHCQLCDNKWASSNSWRDMYQRCKKCNRIVYPHRQRALLTRRAGTADNPSGNGSAPSGESRRSGSSVQSTTTSLVPGRRRGRNTTHTRHVQGTERTGTIPAVQHQTSGCEMCTRLRVDCRRLKLVESRPARTFWCRCGRSWFHPSPEPQTCRTCKYTVRPDLDMVRHTSVQVFIYASTSIRESAQYVGALDSRAGGKLETKKYLLCPWNVHTCIIISLIEVQHFIKSEPRKYISIKASDVTPRLLSDIERAERSLEQLSAQYQSCECSELGRRKGGTCMICYGTERAESRSHSRRRKRRRDDWSRQMRKPTLWDYY